LHNEALVLGTNEDVLQRALNGISLVDV